MSAYGITTAGSDTRYPRLSSCYKPKNKCTNCPYKSTYENKEK